MLILKRLQVYIRYLVYFKCIQQSHILVASFLFTYNTVAPKKLILSYKSYILKV